MAIVQTTVIASTGESIENASLFYNRDGTITGKAKYGVSKSGSMSLTIGQNHPYSTEAHLAQFGYEWDVSGFIFADCDYAGIWSSTVYMVDGIAATQQEPIVTNPNWVNIGGYPTAPANQAYYDPTSQDFVSFPSSAPNDLGGVQSYLAGGFTVRITNGTTDSGDVTDAIELLGLSYDSVVAGEITYSYSYQAFLCSNVTYKEVPLGTAGAVWTLTVEYTWTPPNGWNSLIYAIGA